MQQTGSFDPARELGLVLSGGGLKGGYEIGVWKALNEKDVTPRITGVSGASIGALNGMLFAKGDYPFAEKLWLNVRQSDLLCLPAQPESEGQKTERRTFRERLAGFGAEKFLELLNSDESVGDRLAAPLGENWQNLLSMGVFSQKRLEELIQSAATREEAAALTKRLFVTCTRVKKATFLFDRDDGCEAVAFDVAQNAHRFETLLMASAAIPAVYPPVELDGESYVDGGVAVGGNTPVRPLYELGYRKIIVVYLQKKPEARIRKADYPGAVFAEIIPGEELYTGPLAAMAMPGGGIASEIDAGYADAMSSCIFER